MKKSMSPKSSSRGSSSKMGQSRRENSVSARNKAASTVKRAGGLKRTGMGKGMMAGGKVKSSVKNLLGAKADKGQAMKDTMNRAKTGRMLKKVAAKRGMKKGGTTKK